MVSSLGSIVFYWTFSSLVRLELICGIIWQACRPQSFRLLSGPALMTRPCTGKHSMQVALRCCISLFWNIN